MNMVMGINVWTRITWEWIFEINMKNGNEGRLIMKSNVNNGNGEMGIGNEEL